jgi:hypothetical protein
MIVFELFKEAAKFFFFFLMAVPLRRGGGRLKVRGIPFKNESIVYPPPTRYVSDFELSIMNTNYF